jgi:hypothetical protein
VGRGGERYINHRNRQACVCSFPFFSLNHTTASQQETPPVRQRVCFKGQHL